MSFPKYPKYRDSGVEWLGEVPEHWEVVPLKHVVDLINGAPFKPTEWSDTGVPIIRIENLNGSEDYNYFQGEIAFRHMVNRGDLLFGWSGNRGTSFGPFIWVGPEPCVLNQHIFRVVTKSIDRDPLFWILRAVTAHVEEKAHGIIGMVHITKGDLGSIKVPIPPFRDRNTMSRFLNREVSQIDRLIAEQQRFIKLLGEERRAVTVGAVTQGLSRNINTKASGTGWADDIPCHWKVLPLKRLVSMKSGETITAANITETGEYPVLGANGLRGYTSAYTHEGEFVLIGRQGALCGNINYSKGRFWASEHAIVVTPRMSLNTRWLGEMLRTMNLGQYSVSAAQPGLSVQFIENISTMVPPVEEQDSIADVLLNEWARIDAIVEEASRAIALLLERRTALITAVVTGKIDVRNLAQPEAA